jgi:hypothetical protein
LLTSGAADGGNVGDCTDVPATGVAVELLLPPLDGFANGVVVTVAPLDGVAVGNDVEPESSCGVSTRFVPPPPVGGAVAVAVGVAVDVPVAVAVGVAVDVPVAVAVGVAVDVPVAVAVGVAVDVPVAVAVGVAVDVPVAVAVGVAVDVPVAVAVGVAVVVIVGVGDEVMQFVSSGSPVYGLMTKHCPVGTVGLIVTLTADAGATGPPANTPSMIPAAPVGITSLASGLRMVNLLASTVCRNARRQGCAASDARDETVPAMRP